MLKKQKQLKVNYQQIKREQDALFKYGLIAPLINNTHNLGSKENYFKHASEKYYILPDGSMKRFSQRTIKRWYYAYLQNGIEGLTKKPRSDANNIKAIPKEVLKIINDSLNSDKQLSTVQVIKHVKQNYKGKEKLPSDSTIHRYRSKQKELMKDRKSINSRLPFEFNYVNEMWQADTSHLDTLMINGKKVKTYLISFIDDKSRFITHGNVYDRDNSVNMLRTLKTAIIKCGVPRILYVDNGAPYKNKDLKRICSQLGINLINTKPYEPTSKGKQERFFSTLKHSFLNLVEPIKYKSLASYEEIVLDYIFNTYNRQKHKGINNQIPIEVFHGSESSLDFKDINHLDLIFATEIVRKVNSDNTISIDNVKYEVPYGYINQKIRVYKSVDSDCTWGYIDDQRVDIKLVNKNANADRPRANVQLSSYPQSDRKLNREVKFKTLVRYSDNKK